MTEGTNTTLIRVAEDATYVLRPFLVRAVARRGAAWRGVARAPNILS
jgi:hypothetical protein